MKKIVLKLDRKCSQCKKTLVTGTECFYEEVFDDLTFGTITHRNVKRIYFTCQQCKGNFQKLLDKEPK